MLRERYQSIYNLKLHSSGEEWILHSKRVERIQNYTRNGWRRFDIHSKRVAKIRNYTRNEWRRSNNTNCSLFLPVTAISSPPSKRGTVIMVSNDLYLIFYTRFECRFRGHIYLSSVFSIFLTRFECKFYSTEKFR